MDFNDAAHYVLSLLIDRENSEIPEIPPTLLAAPRSWH